MKFVKNGKIHKEKKCSKAKAPQSTFVNLTLTRKTRFITNLVATQTDADFTSQQGKAEVILKIIYALGDNDPTKQKK